MPEAWSPETWAWEQIRSGKVADFNAHFGKTSDPQKPDGWGDDRKISSGFLRRLFFKKPFCDEIAPEGVRIIGAYLPDGLVLEHVRVPRQVWLEQCRCEGQIDFEGNTISGWFSLEKSFFRKLDEVPVVDFQGTTVEGAVSFPRS
jgi:hypothetical protein